MIGAQQTPIAPTTLVQPKARSASFRRGGSRGGDSGASRNGVVGSETIA